MRPLPYRFSNGALVLGHYMTAQVSGAIAATPTALDVWARVRWVPTVANAKLVLCRLRVGLSVITAITANVQVALQATIARAFVTDFTTACTKLSMAGDYGKMDSANMSSSQMGASGPGICTTAPCTGQGYTLDTAPFAIACVPALSPTLGASAVTAQVGCSSDMIDLYNWQQLGGHPPTLKTGEGIVVQTTNTGHASGTVQLYCEWTWGEVINPFGQG